MSFCILPGGVPDAVDLAMDGNANVSLAENRPVAEVCLSHVVHAEERGPGGRGCGPHGLHGLRSPQRRAEPTARTSPAAGGLRRVCAISGCLGALDGLLHGRCVVGRRCGRDAQGGEQGDRGRGHPPT